MLRFECRLLIVACLFTCSAGAAAGELAAELKIGTAVLAQRPGVQFRVKSDNISEMHAGVIDHVQKVQGEWLWLGRGWVRRCDVVPIWDAVEHFTAEIERKPTAFCLVARALAAATRGDVHANAICQGVEDALTLDANFAPGHWARGRLFDAQGEFDRAIECYDDALWLNPRFAEVYADRGGSWARKGQPRRARKDVDRAIQLCPKLASACHLRSVILQSQGDIERALCQAQEAVKLDPFYATAYQHMGDCWLSKGDDGRAIAAVTQAIRLDAKQGLAYLRRGQIYSRSGEFQRALVDVNRAVQLLPKNVEAREVRAYVYYRLGATEKCNADRIAASRMRPSAQDSTRQQLQTEQPPVANQAVAGRGRVEDLPDWMKKAIGSNGARDLSLTVQPSMAAANETLELHWGEHGTGNLNQSARRAATSTDERYRNGPRAVELATEACEKTEWKRADFLDTLAAAYAETGDFDAAIEWQTKAIELTANAALKADAEQRLQLYRDHQACREDKQGRMARKTPSGGDPH